MESRARTFNRDLSFDSRIFCAFISFCFFLVKKVLQKKRELNPKDFENGLMNIQKSFHNLMAKGYEELHSTDKKLYLDGNTLKEQVADLERTIQGLKNFLDSKKD